MFQSTHSLRSATGRAGRHHQKKTVSIHALLAECDLQRLQIFLSKTSFNPRTPCGVRPMPAAAGTQRFRFQSTHSLRSATRRRDHKPALERVSIHALLAECDQCLWTRKTTTTSFNPRTPCGVRHTSEIRPTETLMFQSTHSLRSATGCGIIFIWSLSAFQSTHSLRSATGRRKYGGDVFIVSIHALLAECDGCGLPSDRQETRFNPRTPCGVRLRPTLYIATQQSKSYFAPTSLKRPSLHGCSF